MFYISLPFFYENYQFNQFFRKYIWEHKEQRVANFIFEYAYGQFPWCHWNGIYNNHNGQAVLNREMADYIQNSMNSFRADCSNINLMPQDIYDTHGNVILDLIKNTNHTIEVSNLAMLQHVQETCPLNKIILSYNWQLINPFNENIIKDLTDRDFIELISLRNLEGIDINNLNKNKIELAIGQCMNCSVEQQNSCVINENDNIYNFSNQPFILNCNISKGKTLNYYEISQPYREKGFTHFKILPQPGVDMLTFSESIIRSFIKSEYAEECLNEYYRTIIRK